MKLFNNIFKILTIGIVLFISSCSVDEVIDPNNPPLDGVLNDASKTELQVLVTGLEARHREYYGSATQMFGSFGREVWCYFGSDPRFISHWLGIGLTTTYTDFFASEGTYINPYLAVKQANVLEASANNATILTNAERKGYLGFAKTIKAYQLIWPLMQQYQNGIRIDVVDRLNPGPTVSYTEALTAIRDLLDEAYNELQSAEFSFILTSGFENFNTPLTFSKVNRAIAARVALYDGAYDDALTILGDSFLDINVDNNSTEKMWVG
ncbi:MAG: RagB/SusD family nutrient uptake outer membrane protein, partial [Cyclobacteriaceae bacterium]|nr:RagB/SusD family nutrient uptake outer membrane protein [Cyclobacteriaceae bacterium]